MAYAELKGSHSEECGLEGGDLGLKRKTAVKQRGASQTNRETSGFSDPVEKPRKSFKILGGN